MVQGVLSEHAIGSPGRHPTAGMHSSGPLQYAASSQTESSGTKWHRWISASQPSVVHATWSSHERSSTHGPPHSPDPESDPSGAPASPVLGPPSFASTTRASADA